MKKKSKFIRFLKEQILIIITAPALIAAGYSLGHDAGLKERPPVIMTIAPEEPKKEEPKPIQPLLEETVGKPPWIPSDEEIRANAELMSLVEREKAEE